MKILKDFVKVNEEGFDSYYISKDGRLLKLYKTGNIKFINPRLDAYGYMRVSITDNNGKRKDRKMHRLMAQTFLPNPENKPEVNHINGDKTDYRLENLEWCTRSENTKHWHKSILNDKGSSSRKCDLYYFGEYVKTFDNVKQACEYAQKNYKASFTGLQKYLTSNSCAIIFK